MAGLRRAQTPPGTTPVTVGYNTGIRPRPARPQPTPGLRLASTPTSTQALGPSDPALVLRVHDADRVPGLVAGIVAGPVRVQPDVAEDAPVAVERPPGDPPGVGLPRGGTVQPEE